jgi:hypothetical protein
LKRRILLLKQAAFDQADLDQSWKQVDVILEVLDKGCKFLVLDENNPAEKEMSVLYYEDAALYDQQSSKHRRKESNIGSIESEEFNAGERTALRIETHHSGTQAK